ncbi:ribosomal L7Ae/L30e/S12e/Gadd45 family protein [Paenibacillus sp. J2TS4]|uniref:L7Ae/L30e/S12e/Gadd45 family ribosomal protein n=1 Tax=Paenibacillus sp. J2TS4 TaxID=2807194 RepID=UPI001B233ED5|nr:ribosomal L7Ae/L30e/S12e/Gadd45 family protein [Paenibacillus sp. J2TS4]GIP33112.1 YlxQ family RNA-binding protein [Paenibacillus sp. J2TS4]
MKNNKLLSGLGLAMRAGKLVFGEEGVLDAIRTGKAKLVLLAMDASENTSKKFRDKCDSYHVPLIEYGTREQLGSSVGKAERVIIAVTDPGFAQMMVKAKANLAEVE